MIQIMPAVREEAVSRGSVPGELQEVFEKTFRLRQRLGENPRRRAAWTKDAGVPVRVLPKDPAPVDVLFYVEDYWSYHPRGQQAAQAFARILHALGVDFAILGAEEKTIGDSQRLAGEKGLFESLMEDVTTTLAKYEFTRIVTPDPHGFNALVKEYPKRGHVYDVAALHPAAGAARRPARAGPRPSTPRSPSTTRATWAAQRRVRRAAHPAPGHSRASTWWRWAAAARTATAAAAVAVACGSTAS